MREATPAELAAYACSPLSCVFVIGERVHLARDCGSACLVGVPRCQASGGVVLARPAMLLSGREWLDDRASAARERPGMPPETLGSKGFPGTIQGDS